MFRTTPEHRRPAGSENLPVSVLRKSMTSLWSLLIKHAALTSRKLSSTNSSTKKLMSTISNKAIQFRRKNKRVEFDGGVWRKTILMGDKCQPLDFSGVIFYDGDGNRVTELPNRSPRATPFAYKSEKSYDNSRLGW